MAGEDDGRKEGHEDYHEDDEGEEGFEVYICHKYLCEKSSWKAMGSGRHDDDLGEDCREEGVGEEGRAEYEGEDGMCEDPSGSGWQPDSQELRQQFPLLFGEPSIQAAYASRPPLAGIRNDCFCIIKPNIKITHQYEIGL